MTGWTCPECGLDFDTITPADAIVAIRGYPRRYGAALALPPDADEAVLARRPSPEVWSGIEYTAHVADLFASFAPALRSTLVSDRPEISFWDDTDRRVIDQAYAELSASEVLGRLTSGAEELASVLDTAKGDDWNRVGIWPWGERDLLAMARNAVHEGSHHLRDVERVIAESDGRLTSAFGGVEVGL